MVLSWLSDSGRTAFSAATNCLMSARTAVLDALIRSGPLSRADVSRVTGLSRSTVSAIVRELMHEELVQERADTSEPELR